MGNEHNDVNVRQKEFYDHKHKNFATRIWSYFRNGLLNRARKNIGMQQEIYDLHKKWLGDLSNKKVLDLGCYEGNSLSYYLAENSKGYIGIDLSEKGIENLNRKLQGFSHAKGVNMDFLSGEFSEKDFDVIYAYGVLHHFKDTDQLIAKLNDKLAPGGVIISYDPLQTSLPIRLIRAVYRPFQTDKDWEWPFTKKVYYRYKEAFDIKEKRGVLGRSKWFFLLNLLPVSDRYKEKKGKELHRTDWERSARSEDHMFQCMHLTMLMQKRPEN